MDQDPHPFDALLPDAMALKAEAAGVRKSQLDAPRLLVLALLAGAFIGLGAAFATTVATGTGAWPYGVARLLTGVAFALGLVLVIVSGAELFTGNALLVMAWASGKVGAAAVLRNWALVYVGNTVGAVATAALVAASGQPGAGDGAVAATALRIAVAKCSLGFVEAVLLGVLCNALVCLAVWMSLAARSAVDKIAVIVPPVAAFVACGFEHSIANLYFVPLAWFSAPAGAPTVGAFLLHNLLPVTLGNLIGGAVLVGGVYWFVFLRGRGERE